MVYRKGPDSDIMSAKTYKDGVLVDKEEFRKCMSGFATGIAVVTSLDDAGHVHGMSANSFTSVCLEPPLVLVCVAHNTNTYGYIENRRCFGINVLSALQEAIGRYFAKPPADRHGDVGYDYSISPECGVPALDGVLAFLGCQVVSSHVYGDHTIYIGEVKEIRTGDLGSPLLFFQSLWYADTGMAT